MSTTNSITGVRVRWLVTGALLGAISLAAVLSFREALTDASGAADMRESASLEMSDMDVGMDMAESGAVRVTPAEIRPIRNHVCSGGGAFPGGPRPNCGCGRGGRNAPARDHHKVLRIRGAPLRCAVCSTRPTRTASLGPNLISLSPKPIGLNRPIRERHANQLRVRRARPQLLTGESRRCPLLAS